MSPDTALVSRGGRFALLLTHSLVLIPVLFPPTVHVAVRPFPVSWLLSLAGILLWVYLLGERLRVRRDILTALGLILAFGAMVVLGGYMVGATSTDVLAQLVIGMGMLLLSYHLVGPLLFRGTDPLRRVYLGFILGIFVHSLLVVLFFVVPDIRLALDPLFTLSDETLQRLKSGFRSAGLTASANEAMAVGKGIALYMLTRLYLVRKIGLLSAAILGAGILCALVLLNRTGLVIGAVGVILAIVSSGVPIRRIFVTFAVSICAASLLVMVALSVPKETLPTAIERTFEPIYTLVETGRLASRSTDVLLGDMLFLPEEQVLYGTGNYGREESILFIASDIGYVRLIFGGGIVAVLVWLVLVGTLTVRDCHGGEPRKLAMFLGIVWLLCNFKILWILPPEAPTVALGLLLYLKQESRKELSWAE